MIFALSFLLIPGSANTETMIDRAPALGLAGVQFSLGLSFLLVWIDAREQDAFVWLAAFLALGSANNLYRYAGGGDMTLIVPLMCGLLYETARAALRIRRNWAGYAIWILDIASFVLQLPSGLAGRGETFIRPATLVTSALVVFYSIRAIRSGPVEIRLIGWALAVYATLFAGPVSISVLGWQLYPMSIGSALFGFILLALLLRRSQADRLEKQRLAGELEAARAVQQLLLRKPDSALIDAEYRPAAEVGGDFWQAYALDDGGHLVAVGDVSGKGLKAAMLVSLITGAFRNRKSDAPSAVLGELNRVLVGGMDGGFVTAIVGRFNPGGRVTIANAGHLSPYLEGSELEAAGGLPLGLDGDAKYVEHEFQLNPGEQITLVSDGVVEAANPRGELFGFERAREISRRPAQEIAEAACAWGQNDDITVVTVRRGEA